MRIVLGNSSLAQYPEGGGLWSWILQYPLGLKDLGHDLLWIELMRSAGSRDTDLRRIRDFYDRLAPYNIGDNCAILLFKQDLESQPFEECEAFGARTKANVRDFIRSADLLLDVCCAIRQPLLSMFKWRALLDFDPGHLQVSAPFGDLKIPDHDVFLTIGARINAPGSEIPTLGLKWRTFEGCVYMPMWRIAPDPGPLAPFSSITQWTWEILPWRDGTLSVSKREAYLKYADVPRLARRPFELAANIGPDDPGLDRQRLRDGGWTLVEPHAVAPTPVRYEDYIHASRAEFGCPKPIHLALRTGWVSERSLAYLASGRPVLAEDTGFTERIPTGAGLIAFHNVEEAVAGVAEIDGNYVRHSRAAREMAEDLFDSRKLLPPMLAACEP